MSSKTLPSVHLLFALAILIFPRFTAASSSCHFPAIYNFGDSNSDTGGLSAVFGQAPPPNGETFFHHPVGRYCDGRLLVDFIANALGLPFLSAYLDSIGSNFTHGANFATAGSTIRPPNSTLRQSGFSPISLDVQWNEFYQFRKRFPTLHSRGGVFAQLLPKPWYFSRSLFTFDIGQNDLTSGYFSNMSTTEVIASIPDVLRQFRDVITFIYGEGGRFFWIHNTGPFGCLAYVLDRLAGLSSPLDKAGCAVVFNGVAQLFNEGLHETVRDLRKELPLAQLVYVDVYTAKYELISHAKEHGFTESLKACCGHGGKYNFDRNIGCGTKKMINGREVMVAPPCKSPAEFVNWDGVHYTEAANKWVFHRIVDGAYSDPRISLKELCLHHSSDL